jgi:hypothetical protein
MGCIRQCRERWSSGVAVLLVSHPANSGHIFPQHLLTIPLIA